MCLWVFICGITEFGKGLFQTNPCSYHGTMYHQGDAWVDDKVCDVCVCNEYGVQCYANLDGPCKFNSTIANAGDAACLYGMTPYLVRNVFSALDGCNTCLCTERGMQCTGKPCSSSGFAKPTTEPLYGECMYDGGWYRFHTQWLARDGCNTCFCYTIGNYRGGHVCTSSKCSCHESSTSIIAG